MPKKILDCYPVNKEMAYMFSLALGTPAQQPDEYFDWDSFYAYTHKNRLEALCAAGAAKLPQAPEQLHKLEQQVSGLQLKTIQQIQLLSHLASVLHQAGIRVLSVKGPLLAADLYGNPALRHSNDLDLLVNEADYEAAKAQLLAAGLTEYTEDHPHYKKDKQHKHAIGEDQHEIFLYNNLYVELHWRISFRYPISFEELWENREEKMLLGQPVFCLGKTDNMIYLICHAAGHGYSRLRWLIDLYKLFTNSSTNYMELYEEMKKKQAEVFLLETLLLLYLLPSFPMPSISSTYFTIHREDDYVHFSFDKTIDAPALRAYHLTELLELLVLSNQDPRGIPERNYMHMLPVVGRKITIFSYLYKLLQPKRAELERFQFPDSLYFLYYIVRPFYKLWRCTPFYKGIYK